MFFGLLGAKPCRIIWTFLQKTNFEPKACKIEPNLWFRSCFICFSAGFGRSFPIRVRPDSGGLPKSEFGRTRAAVPNMSSARFRRPSPIWVRPDSDGRAGLAGFGRTLESKCMFFRSDVFFIYNLNETSESVYRTNLEKDVPHHPSVELLCSRNFVKTLILLRIHVKQCVFCLGGVHIQSELLDFENGFCYLEELFIVLLQGFVLKRSFWSSKDDFVVLKNVFFWRGSPSIGAYGPDGQVW